MAYVEIDREQVIRGSSPQALNTLIGVLLNNKIQFEVLNPDGSAFQGKFSTLIDPNYTVPLKLKVSTPPSGVLNIDVSPTKEEVASRGIGEVTLIREKKQLTEQALKAGGCEVDYNKGQTFLTLKSPEKEITPEIPSKQTVVEPSIEDKFLEKMRKEREEELSKLKISDKGEKVTALHKHFEDRMVAMESAFSSKAKKASGVSEGYVAQRDSDNHLFMMKKAMKAEASVLGQSRSSSFDSMNFVNEFVTAPLYKRLLYDRTPIVEGVESTGPGLINLRSKFLHEFQTVAEFTESAHPSGIGYRSDKLKTVQGAEKLFAAMLFGGEYDIHAGNIGVMTVKDESGKDIQVYAKIDHGWSASQFFSDPKIMMENFANAYKTYNYQNNVDLNIIKFKEAINETLTISDQETEVMIKARTSQLKKMGFDIKDLEFPLWENDKAHSFDIASPKYIKFSSFAELENHYIEHYKKQKEAMKGLSQALSVIEKIEPTTPAWKNGKWIAEIKGKDPVVWAIDNKKAIAGQDPYIWAIDNKKAIAGQDPIKVAISKGHNIEGKDPILWVIDKNLKIEGRDPVEWAITNNKKIEGKDPVAWAAAKNKAAAKVVLEKHFEDKQVATTAEFSATGGKQAGVSTGYVADRRTDTQRFMLKHAFRRNEDVQVEQQGMDRRDLVNEFIMAPLYKRFLFDRTPVIELVNKEGESITNPKTGVVTIKPKASEKDIYIRSKFLDEFQMLGNFSGNTNPKGYDINNNSAQLQKVEGFEKVMAASLILGEIDYHAGNIGVVKKTDESGKEHYVAVKIDHGRSALDTFSSESAFRKGMIDNFKEMGYLDNKGDVILPFSAEKLKGSIDEMLKISEGEITNFVQSRVQVLRQAGFDFKGNDFTYFEDIEKEIAVNPKKVGEIEALYINKLIKHIAIMKEFSSTLEVIAKSDAPENIKNGGWLSSLGTKDPILWAVDKDYKIEGKDPVAWAMVTGHKIQGKDPVAWAIESKSPEEVQKLIRGLDLNNSKLDILTPILAAYTSLKETGGSKENLAKLEAIYEVAAKEINPSINNLGLVNKDSNLGKMLSSGNSETIARHIDNMKNDKGGIPIKSGDLTSGKLMENCSLDVAYKMAKVGNILAEREEKQLKGESASIGYKIKEGLKSFANSIKTIFGKGVSSKQFTAALSDLKEIGDRKEVPLVEMEHKPKAKDNIGKFAKKVEAERSTQRESSVHI